MTTFFTDLFIEELTTNPGRMTNANLRVVLFTSAPKFDQNDPRYVTKKTVAELQAMPGWIQTVATGYPFAHNMTMVPQIKGQNTYVRFPASGNYPFTGLAALSIRAIGVIYIGSVAGTTDPLIFVTNTPIPRQESMVLAHGDSLTAQPDFGLSTNPPNRWLFSWAAVSADAPAGTKVKPVEGPLTIVKGAPTFETGHVQHVWIYPQRVNFVANPSFELAEVTPSFWSSNGTITRVAGGAPGGGAWAGSFSGVTPLRVEANKFPVYREGGGWTIQLMAKGNGPLKVGIVYWDSRYAQTAVDWGTDEWPLSPDTFTHITTHRHTYEAREAMLRLEVEGTSLTLDRVLVEPGHLMDWPYFDGNTKYGARDDYSWYGGTNRQFKSYSMWYNNKNAVMGRLFAWDLGNDMLITDEEMSAQGYVYQWVPAGIQVTPHPDVLHPFDPVAPLPAKEGGVLPYKVDANDMMGITNPWV